MDGEWILELAAPAPKDFELGMGDRRVGDKFGPAFVGSGVLSLPKMKDMKKDLWTIYIDIIFSYFDHIQEYLTSFS